MRHHSCFDQLLAATEELIHQNERVRANFALFEARLRDVLENQKALFGAAQPHIQVTPLGRDARNGSGESTGTIWPPEL